MLDLMSFHTPPSTLQEKVEHAIRLRSLLAAGASKDELIASIGGRANEEAKHLSLLWSLDWAMAGFPIIKMSPKWAAASMVTTAPREVEEGLNSPWPSFVIELPKNEDILFMAGGGRTQPVSHLEVGCYRKSRPEGDQLRWTIWINNRNNIVTVARLMVPSLDTEDLTVAEANDVPIMTPAEGEMNLLTMTLATRLLLSVLCAMQDSKSIQRVGHSSKTKNERTGAAPTVYQIVEPVKVDLTEHVRQYQLGEGREGKKLNLQLVVRGHRKNQRHGEGRRLIKRIWIEPYIRGPEVAPMALRAHMLKTE